LKARACLLASASLVALACSSAPPPSATPGTSATSSSATSSSAAPGTTQPAATTPPAATPPAGSGTIGGPGDAAFFGLDAGLVEIESYTAALTRAFEGTKDGAGLRWSFTWTMARSHGDGSAELRVVTNGDAAPVAARHAWDIGPQHYEEDENGCAPEADESGLSGSEPASMLTGVIGAEAAGADHYTFDERALGLAGMAQATGEMWMGKDSFGATYLSRYQLAIEAGPDYFGAGVDGTLTTFYEVTGVNEPTLIHLPGGCAVAPVEQVLMADASHVISAPGFIQYTTAASIDDVLAFYQVEAPEHGWTLIGTPITNGGTAGVLEFSTANGQLTVFATADEGGTTVALSTDQPPAP